MSKKKNILLIGYKSAIIDVCTKLNIRVVNLVDARDKPNQLPSCKSNEIRIATEDNGKSQQMICALARNNELSFDAILTTDEHSIVSTSILSKSLSIKGLYDPISAIAFKDNYYQKELLREEVKVAKSWIFENKNSYFEKGKLSYPVVLKILSEYGTSSHTHITNSQEELVNLIDVYKNLELTKGFKIQEFIEGEEIYIDGWVCDSELQMFTMGKYGKHFKETENGWLTNGINLNPRKNQELYNHLRPFILKVLDKLYFKNGIFHMELFSSESGFIFNEFKMGINGEVISQTFHDMLKVNFNEMLVRLSLGERFLDLHASPPIH